MTSSNHKRIQAARDPEQGYHDRLYTLQRFRPLPTSRVKVQRNFAPNHAEVDQTSQTTLPRCDGIGTLRGFSQDTLTRQWPLMVQHRQHGPGTENDVRLRSLTIGGSMASNAQQNIPTT